MNHGINKIGVRTKLVISTLLLAVAAVANAGTQVAGGSTLMAIGYVGTGAQTSFQVYPAATNSLFGVWTRTVSSTSMSYCQTDDGPGKNILAGVSNYLSDYNVQNFCPTSISGPTSTVTLTGFGANATGVGRPDLTWPNIVAADSPLNAIDLSNYSTYHSPSYLPVQFPAVAGAIAIALNERTALGVQLGVTNTNFSDLQICEIFSGIVVNWNDPKLASAFTLGAGDSIQSAPINVQYDPLGSGTTFAFSNHLANAGQAAVSGGGVLECGSITSSSIHFVTNQAFASAVALYLPTLPSNWKPTSWGDPAVAAAIAATTGSIGYVGYANAMAAGINFTEVNGVSPASFGARVAISPSIIVTNEYINGADPVTGLPVLTAISPAPSTECIMLVTPSSYGLPTSGYPIMAVSYLLGSSQGNGTDLSNVQSLLFAPYNSMVTQSRNLTTFGIGKGAALLTGTGITNTTINNCVIN
ncbi:MAG: substrate-binding domain-containing protein [Rhodanobacter sp.]